MSTARGRLAWRKALGWVAAGAGALAFDVAINLVANVAGGALSRVQQLGLLATLVAIFVLIRQRYFGEPEEPEVGTDPPPDPSEPLPPAIALLGRDQLVETVAGQVSQHGRVLVHGPTGMGVSAVAVGAARRLVPAADQQIYLDLAGQRSDSARRVAIRVLSALRLRPGRIPDLAAAADSVRGALRDTGRVLVLDNVTSADQVGWVAHRIPGAYLVLAGDVAAADLPGVPDLPVGPLDTSSALELCCRQDAGDHPGPTVSARVAEDPQAAQELAEAYLKLPQTAIESGKWLAANPGVSVPDLLADLRRQKGSSAAARHLLELQLTGASDGARALLAALLRVPLEEWSEAAVAVLAGQPRERAAVLLDELVARSLVVRTGPALYRVQRDASSLEARPGPRDGALARLASYYARLATEWAAALPAGHRPQQQLTAERWFRAEERALLGLLDVPDPPRSAEAGLWLIADALEVWFTRDNRPTDRDSAAQAMARAARQLRDSSALVTALVRLAAVARLRGDLPAAESLLAEAREHAGDSVERGRGSAVLHTNLGLYLLACGRTDEALGELERSRERRPHRDTVGRVVDLTNLGAGHLRAGRLAAAQEKLSAALAVAEDSNDVAGQAHALELLGIVAFQQHNQAKATERWAMARLLYEQEADDLGQARCLRHLAAAGRTDTPASATPTAPR
jgi:tetratricopeptide (TPR) repeat protein